MFSNFKSWNTSSYEKLVKIPPAAVVFHNIIRMHHGDEAWLDNQPDNIPPASFVDLPDGDSN
jgi:hypothetical protein